MASLLGDQCGQIPAIRELFTVMRAEALVRLRATASAMQLRQAWILRLPGGFNEQALSNIVYAFDRAQLLDQDLLQAAFTVAAMRLDSSFTGLQRPTFKPQELCTLLRAAQTNIAQPWAFLGKLVDAVVAMPFMFESWSGPERAELQRGLALLNMQRTTLMLQQLQQQQQQLQYNNNLDLHTILSDQMSALSLGGSFQSPGHGMQQHGMPCLPWGHRCFSANIPASAAILTSANPGTWHHLNRASHAEY